MCPRRKKGCQHLQRHSQGGQGHMGIESGDSEDDLRRRDRAYRHVRIVRLALAASKLGVRKCLMLYSSIALKACRLTEQFFIPR
ncbi:hypothetical protein EVAR_53191_1 [Eumeta japonica]|uniref:Uncharacterized protein n=1 Tax=Eumeta variegata TaxID=151549 RepID=A0A4C1YU71_EUMVA|nr:hypothetical protein EVAR_53191_1 [Eumeta japonica]